MIYIVVFLFLLLLTVYYDISGRIRGKTKWEHIMVVVLILLSALRNQVGDDTFKYEFVYHYYPTLGQLFNTDLAWESLSQPLWVLLNCIFKSITEQFFLFQCFIAIIFNTFLYYFFKSISRNVFTCFLLFFCTRWYVYNFEVLRESLSVIIYLFAIVDYIRNNKLKRYFLICTPAALIHWFAIIMILITPVFMKVKRTITLPVMIVLGIGILFLARTTISGSLDYASRFVSQEYFHEYLSDWNTRQLNVFIFLQAVLLRMLLPFIIIVQGNEEKENRKIIILKRILVFNILVGGLATQIVIGYRLLNYLFPILIVLVVEYFSNSSFIKVYNRFYIKDNKVFCFKGENHQSKKHLLVTYTLVFCLLSLVLLEIRSFIKPPELEFRSTINYDCRYLPYTSIFEEKNPIRTKYYYSTSHAFDEKLFGE